MIDQIKNYACGIVIVVLLTVTGMAKYETHSIETEYKKYKENINDQLQKAKIEKARIEAEQKAKHDREIADYAADLDRLNRILAGLQKPGTVPREASVPVAGSDRGIMPRETEDTSGAINPAEIDSCVKRSTFFAAAMIDTLQCSRLIEFVKD